jgi:ABC-type polysaccharide/polyol phosphate export permease
MIFSQSEKTRFYTYLNLLREIGWTEFKLWDQGTLLGFLWTLLYPTLMCIVLYMVFVKWMGQFVNNYCAYLLIGLLFWNFFQRATSSALTSLTRRYSIIRNFKFPREIIVFSTLFAVLCSFLLEICVLLMFLPFTGVAPRVSWLLLPVLLVAALLFTTGISLFLPLLAAEYRDMERIWEVVTMALFYLTPVFYPLKIINPKFGILLLLNPVTQIIIAARGCLIDGTVPNAASLSALIFGSVLLLAAGVFFLRRYEYQIMDRIME